MFKYLNEHQQEFECYFELRNFYNLIGKKGNLNRRYNIFSQHPFIGLYLGI